MSQRSDLSRLINRGRKAGLNTRDLYSALSTRSADSHEQPAGSSDCNGFVSAFDAAGHRVFQPLGSPRRA